jgi:hypothetical protein
VVGWWVADEEGVGVTACLHRDQAAQVDQSRAAHTKHGGTKGEKANVARGGGWDDVVHLAWGGGEWTKVEQLTPETAT